jgi:hypothetical protein
MFIREAAEEYADFLVNGRQSYYVLHLQHIPLLEEFCNMTKRKKERKSLKHSWI